MLTVKTSLTSSLTVLSTLFLTSLAAQAVAAPSASTAVADSYVAAPSEGEIGAIINVFNQREVATGQLAQTNATNPKIIDFANLMVKEHTRIATEFAAVLRKAGLAVQEGPSSASVRAEGSADLVALRAVSGLAFDQEYLRRQIAINAELVSQLDGTLIPGAANADLKSYLVALRGDISKYLGTAEGLKAEVGI